MSHPVSSGSWPTWVKLLPAFVFVAAAIAVSGVLLQRDTWRRDTLRREALQQAALQQGTLQQQILQQEALGQDAHTDAGRIQESRPDAMKPITECFAAVVGTGSNQRRLELKPEPLARWSNPAQELREAALWAWGGRGRPAALVAIEHYAGPRRGADGELWGFEMISLADGPLEVEGTNEVRAMNATSAAHSEPVMGGSIHWTPKGPGLTFRDVPGAPAPAGTAQDRLSQMKDLIKRFSALVHPGRWADRLELAPEAIDRYANLEAGQLDGAIFSFALRNNPEVIVVLEAQVPTSDKASWRYAAAQATAAAFEVAIDGKKVWSVPYHSEKVNTPGESYFIVGMPRSKP